jgi:hypothetical protein
MDRQKILDWYDGYSWDGEIKVINPYSLFNYLRVRKFKNFWYQSGTPRFLLDIMRQTGDVFIDTSNLVVKESGLQVSDVTRLDIRALLFQSGYLTVVEAVGDRYRLDFPNKEVKEAYQYSILNEFARIDDYQADEYVGRMTRAIAQENIADIGEILGKLYSGIPNDLYGNNKLNENESLYHAIAFTIFKFIGSIVRPEESTATGRADMILETSTHVYVIEFKYSKYEDKVDDMLDEALQQIEKQDYAGVYRDHGKKIVKLAICVYNRKDVKTKI